MKKAYLAISYSNRRKFDNEIKGLQTLFSEIDVELLVFVDEYNFRTSQETEMMNTAFMEIDSSDLLIAELTTKSIGVGIEIGYSYAKNKPIIYLRKIGSEYSTTAAGTSNFTIEYEDEFDLVKKMKQRLLNESMLTGL